MVIRDVSSPVVFFELTGDDVTKLEKFYDQHFGWKPESRPFPGYTYTRAGGNPGLKAGFRQEKGAPAERVLYIGVSDVKAKLDEVTQAGATVAVPCTTVPGVGTFAVFVDIAGNRMGLFEHK